MSEIAIECFFFLRNSLARDEILSTPIATDSKIQRFAQRSHTCKHKLTQPYHNTLRCWLEAIEVPSQAAISVQNHKPIAYCKLGSWPNSICSRVFCGRKKIRSWIINTFVYISCMHFMVRLTVSFVLFENHFRLKLLASVLYMKKVGEIKIQI